jgi:hypothetical protein
LLFFEGRKVTVWPPFCVVKVLEEAVLEVDEDEARGMRMRMRQKQ